MTVTISPAILADSELREQIDSLSRFLQQETGPLAQAAHATWDLHPGDPSLVEFHLRDSVTARRTYFHRDDLRSRPRRELRALQAVNYFLEQHSRRNMDRLNVLIGKIAEEEELAHGVR